MPSTTVTPWGHHLPDPEVSRAATERILWSAASRRSRRAQSDRRRTASRLTWGDPGQLEIAAGATNR